MSAAPFDKPVVLLLPYGAGGQVRTEIRTPREAIAAMARDGLGEFKIGNATWSTAFSLLTRAVLDPTPNNLEAARTALEALAAQAATHH